jgi:hypothetical protein
MHQVRKDLEALAAEGENLQRVSLRRAANFTALLGAIYSVLFIASMVFIRRIPHANATDQEITDFYNSNDRRAAIAAGLYLIPFSAVAFLWFIVLLREWVTISTRRISRVLSNVQLLSGISFITLTFAAAAASTVVAATVEFSNTSVDPDIARQFPVFGNVLIFILGMRMAAIFVLTTTNIGRAAGIFPRWFIWGSFAVAAFLFLVATLSVWLVLVFPVWVLTLSALLFYRARSIPRDEFVPATDLGEST